MKKYLSTLLAVCLMLTALSMPASALEYTFDSPPTGDFGTPTSTEDIIQTGAEPANKDRSKSSALIPPGFGTPTSYLPNSGEYLTQNLAADGPLSGNYTLTVTGGTGGGAPALPGAVDTSAPSSPAYPTTSGPVTAFTDVTADLYYRNGSLGTLEKLPTVRSLQAEYAALLAEKKAAYADFRRAREDMKELLTVRANVQKLMGYEAQEQEKEADRREEER